MWLWNMLVSAGAGTWLRIFGVVIMNGLSFAFGSAFQRARAWRLHRQILNGEGAHGKVPFKQVLLPKIRARRHVELPGEEPNACHRVLTVVCVEDPPADRLFGNETPLSHEWYRRAKKCTLANPVVSMDGIVGSHILDRFVKFITARHRQHERKSSIWILAPVHEMHRLLRDRAPAVMLIQREDLEYLMNWSFCQRLLVDEPWNAAHIVGLHHIACAYARFRAAYIEARDLGKPDTFGEQFREVVLPLNTEWPEEGTDYYVPNWHDVCDLLTAHNLKRS